MRHLFNLSLLVMLLLSLTACGSAGQTGQSSAPPPMPAVAPMEAPMPPVVVEKAVEREGAAGASALAGVTDAAAGAGQEGAPVERKIIYRADMNLVVMDTEQAMQQIQDLVEASNGYVANSNLSQYRGDLLRGNMTVRVPVENFDDILARLRELAVRVVHESSNAEDVTAEYTDLSARLRNLEAAEQELLALLTEVRERPNATAEDILDVFNALSEKRGEIEQVKGRMQYLDNLTALSTITIDLTPDELGKPVIEEGWQPLVTVKDAFRTLIHILQGLVDLVIGFLIVVLPVLLIVAMPIVAFIFFVRWLVQRRRRKG